MDENNKTVAELEKIIEEKDRRILELESRLAEYEAKLDNSKKAKKPLLGMTKSKFKKRTFTFAVHLHLYNSNQLTNIVSYLENIPFKYDIYCSCKEGCDIASIKTVIKNIKHVQKYSIESVQDCGADIAPMLINYGSKLRNYDYMLHINGGSISDIQYDLEVLLGSAEKLEYIIDLFDKENAGLIFPDISDKRQMIDFSWLNNKELADRLLEEFGIFDVPQVFNFPIDGFFFARVKAIDSMLKRDFSIEDFVADPVSGSGPMYDTILRVLPFLARDNDFDNYILYLDEKSTKKNVSLRPFNSYFKLDTELLSMKLTPYDIVSFDIFDTLLTFDVNSEVQIYQKMQEEILSKYEKDVDFVTIRKEAENKAIEKYGVLANIDKIYVELSANKDIGGIAPQIKQLEIDTMYKLCLPRENMVGVYNSVRNMGKHTILVSDMFLTKAHLVAMLRKCGIGNYSELFIGWEIGASKEDGSMYNAILSGLNTDRFIHIGDDFYQDSLMLARRNVASHAILSPKAEKELMEAINQEGFTIEEYL